jgi:hypothetical protein
VAAPSPIGFRRNDIAFDANTLNEPQQSRKTCREPQTHLRFEINSCDSCSHPLQQRKFISSTSSRSET